MLVNCSSYRWCYYRYYYLRVLFVLSAIEHYGSNSNGSRRAAKIFYRGRQSRATPVSVAAFARSASFVAYI